MGSARREIKIVAGIALLAVSVAVAAAVFLSTNLTGKVDVQRTAARELREQVATLNDDVEAVQEKMEDADTANASLKGGYKQCQKALELTEEFVIALFDIGPEASDAEYQAVEDLGHKIDKASGICLATRVDLVDTY
jgi:outer membrane murein-binding lipoprotein Lpp